MTSPMSLSALVAVPIYRWGTVVPVLCSEDFVSLRQQVIGEYPALSVSPHPAGLLAAGAATSCRGADALSAVHRVRLAA
jgi:hypothetical protein